LTIAAAIAVTLAYECAISVGKPNGFCSSSSGDYERTFYHGTSGYAAEAIVAAQYIEPLYFTRNGVVDETLDFGVGFYMSEDRATAAYFAVFKGIEGRNGGRALVVVDIMDSRWKFLLRLGAIDSAPISGMAGQSQAFVPVYLFTLFNLLKTRFSFAPLD